MYKVGRLFIFCGVILMLIPIIGKVYVTHEQDVRYLKYLKEVACTSALETKDNEQNGERKQEIPEVKKVDAQVQLGEVIGKIKMDKIGVDLILTEGTDEAALKIGAGHMENTAFPGEIGNCVIAGHRNYTFGSMFNRLDEMGEGDSILIEYKGKQYHYTVTEVSIVKPEELSVISQETSNKCLTLITCHPVYSSKYRLIVKGQLKAEV